MNHDCKNHGTVVPMVLRKVSNCRKITKKYHLRSMNMIQNITCNIQNSILKDRVDRKVDNKQSVDRGIHKFLQPCDPCHHLYHLYFLMLCTGIEGVQYNTKTWILFCKSRVSHEYLVHFLCRRKLIQGTSQPNKLFPSNLLIVLGSHFLYGQFLPPYTLYILSDRFLIPYTLYILSDRFLIPYIL